MLFATIGMNKRAKFFVHVFNLQDSNSSHRLRVKLSLDEMKFNFNRKKLSDCSSETSKKIKRNLKIHASQISLILESTHYLSAKTSYLSIDVQIYR